MLLSAALVAPVAWTSAVEQLVGATGLTMTVPLARLGSLTDGDAEDLRAALAAALRHVTTPVFRFAGGVEVPRPTEPGLICRFPLEGGSAEATALFTAVHETARQVGILVDRRTFRPVLEVPMTRRPLPSRAWTEVLTALEPWSADEVHLLRPCHDAASPVTSSVHRVLVGA